MKGEVCFDFPVFPFNKLVNVSLGVKSQGLMLYALLSTLSSCIAKPSVHSVQYIFIVARCMSGSKFNYGCPCCPTPYALN